MNYYKKMIGSLLVFAGLLMTGCLKDKDVDDGRIGVKPDRNSKIIEMMGPLSGLVVRTLEASTSDVTFTAVTVRLAAEQPAQVDVQVTLQVDPAAVTAYNTARGTNYISLPANMYTIPSLTVSIPKGSRTADLTIKAVPNNLAGTPYALGFSIASVSDPSVKISGNYKTLVAAIGVKNEFEATYKAVGYFAHPTAPRAINTNKYMSTVGANSSESLLGDLAGTFVVLTVNPDNTVSIAPGTGTAGTTASVAKINDDPVYNNTYDPATKTFKLKYGYPNPGPTRIITETLTRQ
jgi:hypothetical protein